MPNSAFIQSRIVEILERHRVALTAQALAIVGGHEDAEDTVQETLLEACRQPSDLSEERLLGRARAINRRNAVDKWRSKRSNLQKVAHKRRQVPENDFTTGGFSQLELRDSMQKAMAKLPDPLRSLVRMRYFEDCSYQDISARLKIPLGAVHGHLMDACAALYARLNAQVWQ